MTSDFNDFNRCLKAPMLPAEVFVKTIRHILCTDHPRNLEFFAIIRIFAASNQYE